MLPERVSTGYTASPLARGSPKKQGVKNRNLKALRRSCPQKLEKSRKAWVSIVDGIYLETVICKGTKASQGYLYCMK
jgi:hypothetical protein